MSIEEHVFIETKEYVVGITRYGIFCTTNKLGRKRNKKQGNINMQESVLSGTLTQRNINMHQHAPNEKLCGYLTPS